MSNWHGGATPVDRHASLSNDINSNDGFIGSTKNPFLVDYCESVD